MSAPVTSPPSKQTLSAQPRQAWRFSLRTLLLGVALLLLVLSHLKATLDLRAARARIEQQSAELEKMREEIGVFEITDRTKPHVLFVPQNEQHSYRWRVYLPPRRREYEICVGQEDIKADGVPTDMYQFQPMGHQEKWITYRRVGDTFAIDVFLCKEVDGNYQWHVRHPKGEMFVPLAPSVEGGQSTWSYGAHVLQVLDPKEPVMLLRFRTSPPENLVGGTMPEGPLDGLIVWIR